MLERRQPIATGRGLLYFFFLLRFLTELYPLLLAGNGRDQLETLT